jgi:hypothetical protein
VCYGCRAWIHHHEHHGRKGIVPCAAKCVAILLVYAAEDGCAAHPDRNGDQGLTTYIMGRADSRHALISAASASR